MAASQTDAEVWPAEAGRKLRVLSVYAVASAATALTFNRKPSGSGVALTPAYVSANGVPTVELPYNPNGWFETEVGDGLSVTTGTGQSTLISVVLAAVRAPDAVEDERRLALLLADRSPIFVESA